MKLKSRLDNLTLEKGLCSDINKARAMILAGKVLVNGQPSTKPGMLVLSASNISLKAINPYVSRGGLKLASALAKLDISVSGKTCLDIGASTGGFTDCLLQNGAKKVYALDVGKNLLDLKLKNDPRVVQLEGVNFRYFSKENLKDEVEFVTIDVSFISLKIIINKLSLILPERCLVLAMIKPQFEAEPKDLNKGIVREEKTRRKIIENTKDFSINTGFELLGEADSGLKGQKGNLECFVLLRKTGSGILSGGVNYVRMAQKIR